MPFNKLPKVTHCCYCIPDLRAATAIIAVLAIATSPALAWAVVRHSYVVRVSCVLSTNTDKPDVVDINLNNVLSFGFGSNAGLGPSCLGKASNSSKTKLTNEFDSEVIRLAEEGESSNSSLLTLLKYIGLIVLLVDIVFVVAAVMVLATLFIPNVRLRKTLKYFMYSALVSIILSFIYGAMFIATCMYLGGSFPIFEFFFLFLDTGLWLTWIYFTIVLNSELAILTKKEISEIVPHQPKTLELLEEGFNAVTTGLRIAMRDALNINLNRHKS